MAEEFIIFLHRKFQFRIVLEVPQPHDRGLYRECCGALSQWTLPVFLAPQGGPVTAACSAHQPGV
jgi:hypothetical protein